MRQRLLMEFRLGELEHLPVADNTSNSPNLYLWRSIAFFYLGNIQRVVNDARQFLSKPTVVAEDFELYHQLFREAGSASKLDIEELAKTRLSEKELKRYHRLIANT